MRTMGDGGKAYRIVQDEYQLLSGGSILFTHAQAGNRRPKRESKTSNFT